MRRRIADWPAVLAAFEIDDPESRKPRTLEIWTVEDLESRVDASELLRNATGVEPPYWALVWIGARAIAARMLDDPPSPHTHVLDLGCGLGLSGVAAGLGGAHVLFADAVTESLEFARASALHHDLSSFDACLLDFTKDVLPTKFDLILAADVVYQPDDYSGLVEFLVRHLSDPGEILLTESLRADAKHVVARLEQHGLSRTTDAVWIPEGGTRERTWVHRFTRSSKAAVRA